MDPSDGVFGPFDLAALLPHDFLFVRYRVYVESRHATT